ncbi:hypothetical protein Tco_1226979 [Tanacetum coccineum]
MRVRHEGVGGRHEDLDGMTRQRIAVALGEGQGLGEKPGRLTRFSWDGIWRGEEMIGGEIMFRPGSFEKRVMVDGEEADDMKETVM